MDSDDFDEAAFDAWLAGDPRRKPTFDTLSRRLMGAEMDAALTAYKRQGAKRRTALAGAAAALIAIAGGYQAIPLIELSLARSQDYAVADGQVRDVTLADGTVLTLAGNAAVKVLYTRHDRIVELAHGTIFANVAHDTRRPFRIDTGNARIVDVGTSFEVLSRPGNVRITVASGIVEFGTKGWFSKPMALTVRQAAVLDEQGLKRIADVSPDQVARWRGEWAEYKGASLGQVIADLQGLSPLPIEIAGQSLAGKPVSGRIKLTDPIGQLENLAITHEFRIERTDQALVIRPNYP